jgi:hypothetical protein
MIYLSPENKSALGEDTFWTWMHREFPGSSFDVPAEIGPRDVVLQYSTLGASRVRGGKKVALLLETHPEIVYQGIPGNWGDAMGRIAACAKASDFRVIPSAIMRQFYEPYGELHELPIAVDTDLFALRDKAALRKKYGFKADQRIGFWSGTMHAMKGYDRLKEYKAANPGVAWIVVWKKKVKPADFDGNRNFTKVSQDVLADLMNCADFMLGTSRLRPFFMVEWEAMACDLPVVNISGLAKDFEPSAHPRADVLARNWSRPQAKPLWSAFLTDIVGAEL